MSDIKRIQLTTVEPPQQEKKPKRKGRTFRFELSLGESNAETCPEYSFTELIKNEKPATNDDPFNDDVDADEVAAIAQRFEAKYGPKSAYSGKKKRTREMDDYYDLGDGYDVDDPFIDNTEAYDEVIPSTMTTKHGGFYINQGQLDFRSLSDDSIQSFVSPIKTQNGKKKKKKGVLDSDSEVETGETLAKKFKAMKRKKLLESKALEKKKKKLSDGIDGEPLIKKKKKKNPQKLMKKLSKPGERQIPFSPGTIPTPTATTTSAIPSISTSITSTTASSNGAVSAISGTGNNVINSNSGVTVAVATSTTSVVSSVQTITKSGENGSKPEMDSEEKPGAVLQDALKDESSSKSGDEGKGEQQTGDKLTPLPAQLPGDMLNSIECLKKCAKESTEGKCKFFSPEINKLLLEIEIGSYSLAYGKRSAIFGHLGDHLPCNKPALLRRAKKLHETQEEDQMKEPMQRLKKAIDAVMPALQEKYQQELHKAKAEAEKNSSTDGPKEEASTESEEDETKQDATSKKFKRPKREFHWTSETRHFLEDIVILKMRSFKIFKSRNQTAEDYIKTFLENDVRRLWPPGWMQIRVLMKECRMCHEDLAKAVPEKPNKDKLVPPSTKPLSAVPSDASITNAVASVARVSKTEDVIEISCQSKKGTEKAGKDSGSRDHIGGRGDTIVVHLPGSSPSIVSPVRPTGPSSVIRKLSPPPVEVIDITESPLKPPSMQSGMAPTLLGSDKVTITQKQGQQLQSSKPISKLTLHQSHQWARQPRLPQPAPGQPSSSRNISTQEGLPLSQPSVSQFKAGDMSSSRWGSNLDSIYQAKVVLKPVSISQGQQQRAGGSAGSTSSKSGNLQQGQTKSSHLTSSTPQTGLSKPPVSFSPTPLVSVSPGQGVQNSSIGSSKLYSQPLQQQKPQAASSSGNSSVISQTGVQPRNQNQQVKSGIILGTSNSHPKARFPHTQSVSKTSNLISYRPQQNPVGLVPGQQTGPNQAILNSPGSNRLSQTVSVSPGSSKSSHDHTSRPAAIRTLPQSHTSPSLMSKSAVLISKAVSSPSPPKRPYQPEQPSPPSRGSNSLSPQQQLSPGEGSAKLTLYEQIQSQMRSQEAMEGQALQNLALARNLMGFAGPKSTRPDVPPTMPSSQTNRAEADIARSVVSASNNKGLPRHPPDFAKLSPSKLQENLLKLRENMGGGTKGETIQNQAPVAIRSGLVPGRVAWQLSQSQTGSVTSSYVSKVSKPKAESQQPMSLKNQKNIFSEMQKSVFDVESLMQARKSPHKSPGTDITKSTPKLKVNPQNSDLFREFGMDKGSNSRNSNCNPIDRAEDITSLFREGNPLAKSVVDVRSVAGSKNGGGDTTVLHQVERKPCTWSEKPNPDKVPGPSSHMQPPKGQGNSGSLSSK